MTNLLIIMLATLVTKNVMAQTTSLLSCFTGGFAYNNLDITEVGSNLRFTTDGNTLEVNSDKLQPKDQFQMVTFSLPKKDCNLENISENDIVCSADRVIFSIKVYNFESGEERIVEDEIQYASLILKKVSNEYKGIKLLVTVSKVKETLYLSNGFKTCK